MIDGLKPYPKYKDSGVPRLGEVPEHWEALQIRRVGSLFKGNGGNKGDEVPVGVPCVRYGDLYTRYEFFIRSTKAYVSKERAADYTSICYGDILFAASGETIEDIGRSAVNLIETDACCGGDVLVLRPRIDAVSEFLGYASDSAASRHQKACMGRGFTVVHIYGSQLKRLVFPFPPLPEQTAIVRFLDWVDRRIRRVIRARKRRIKLLEEYKQALINQAVTGQIDVRTGKPYPKYKHSGVEWLGEVPAHWEVVRIKFVAHLKSGESITAERIEEKGPIPVYGGNGLRGFTCDYTHEGEFVLVGRQGALCGNINYASGRFWASEHAVVAHPLQDIAVRWFGELLRSMNLNQHSIAAAQPGLAVERIQNLPVPVPPILEQCAIAEFLDEQTQKIDTAIAADHRVIDLLKEFRMRLIADVVTGKLDVREAVAKLPEEPDSLGQEEELGDLMPDESNVEINEVVARVNDDA